MQIKDKSIGIECISNIDSKIGNAQFIFYLEKDTNIAKMYGRFQNNAKIYVKKKAPQSFRKEYLCKIQGGERERERE